VIGLALARESTEHTRLELMHMADKHNHRHNNGVKLQDSTSNISSEYLRAFSTTAHSGESKRAAPGEVMLQDMLRKGVFENSTGAAGAGTFNKVMYEIFESLNKVYTILNVFFPLIHCTVSCVPTWHCCYHSLISAKHL
jgi:hypothetical protein